TPGTRRKPPGGSASIPFTSRHRVRAAMGRALASKCSRAIRLKRATECALSILLCCVISASFMIKYFFLSAAVICLTIISDFARAQTGPELMLRPWQKDERVQVQGDFRILNEGSTKASDDFRLTEYDTSGRVRLMPEQRAQPTLGWNYTDFNTS